MGKIVLAEHANVDYAAIKRVAMILRAINHKKINLPILKLLNEKKRMKVTDIYVKLRLKQSIASQHLAILRRADLVTAERDGREIYYSLNRKRIAEVVDFLNKLTTEPYALIEI